MKKEAKYKLEVLDNSSFYVLGHDSYYISAEPADGAVSPPPSVPLGQLYHGFG